MVRFPTCHLSVHTASGTSLGGSCGAIGTKIATAASLDAALLAIHRRADIMRTSSDFVLLSEVTLAPTEPIVVRSQRRQLQLYRASHGEHIMSRTTRYRNEFCLICRHSQKRKL